jgi:dolichol kinase
MAFWESIDWSFVERCYNTALSLSFFILMGLMYVIAIRGYRAKNRYGGVSSMLCAICFLIFGVYNSINGQNLIIDGQNTLIIGFFPFPYNGFMVWWIGMNLILNYSFYLIIKRDIKKMKAEGEKAKKSSILRRYILRMTKEDPYVEDIPFKRELIRKTFHLSGLLLLIVYFGMIVVPPLALLISDSVIVLVHQIAPAYNMFWGFLTKFPFTFQDPNALIYLTMMGIMGSLFFAIISDIIRVLRGPEYSLFNFITKSMLRNKERNAAGPQVYIITGFMFSFMLVMAGVLNVNAYFAGILIACFSDAAAALIGRRFGKHKVHHRFREPKSIEGFVAGVVVAYFIGLIFLGPIYAIIGAIIFFITDYFPAFTADNITNPIFIPIGFQIAIWILGLPVVFF